MFKKKKYYEKILTNSPLTRPKFSEIQMDGNEIENGKIYRYLKKISFDFLGEMNSDTAYIILEPIFRYKKNVSVMKNGKEIKYYCTNRQECPSVSGFIRSRKMSIRNLNNIFLSENRKKNRILISENEKFDFTNHVFKEI